MKNPFCSEMDFFKKKEGKQITFLLSKKRLKPPTFNVFGIPDNIELSGM